MSTDTQHLVQQSLRGDHQAFGEIVARYQSTVSAVAYSVTGNLAQSEDLAQEAFILAWRKLGTLEKPDAIAPWLCSIARNLARNWIRKQSRRPTVSMDSVAEVAQPAGEAPEAQQERQERADLVWGALADIPETYREPLILFYRQGQSVRAIAEALELTEDNVKQRLSRGRKMLRAEVEAMVESTLTDTRPGKAFTAGVLAALPALYGARAGAAETKFTIAKAVAAPAAVGVLLKMALPIAATVALALAGLWWGRDALPAGESGPMGVDAAVRNGERIALADDREKALEATVPPVIESTAPSNPAAGSTTSIVSGTVVIRGTDEPAPGMRVVYGRQDIGLKETLTDEAGRFSFEDVPAGEYALLAYDARYAEMPEDDYRSEHYLVTVAAGEPSPERRIEVPPSGLALMGRITDAATGAPLPNLSIAAVGSVDRQPAPGVSDAEGRYRILGLNDGQWRVFLNSNNPLFRSDYIEDMQSIVMEGQSGASLDFAVDRGVPISGVVIDATGKPVSEARVWAELYPAGGKDMRCNFAANQSGEFTVWGARPGDTATLSAARDPLVSHKAVVILEPSKDTESITLVLLPRTTVSGRFADEEGRSVAADLWSRAYHPDVPGGWQGRTEDAATFTADFTQGEHELQGLVDGMQDMGRITQRLMVGPEPITGVVVQVVGPAEAGNYRISGRVVDEQGQPLRKCRVYVSGDSRETLSIYEQTHTDPIGQFQFDGLADGTFTVHAVPGDPYEQFAGYEKLNPAETPEVTIVARRAPVLRGRVLDATSGKPITSFNVDCGEYDVHDRELRWGPSSPSIHAETGEFSFPAQLDKQWFLRVSAGGYALQRVTGEPLTSGEEPDVITFKLMPSRVVQGTVLDSAGNAVPRAFVFLNSGFINGAMKSLDTAVAESDSDGRFSVDSIPAEAEFLYIWKSDYAAVREPIAENVNAVLHAGGIVEGRITVNGAEPEGELTVYARAPETADSAFARIEPGGVYRMEHLMDAAYGFEVNIQGVDGLPGRYFLPEKLVEVRHDTIVTHDIDVPVGNASVEGVILNGGAPVEGVEVQCRNGSIHLYTTSDERGFYRFERLSPGPVVLSVHVPSELPAANPYHAVFETEIAEGESIQQDLAWPE